MTDLHDIESRLGKFRPRRPAAIPDQRLQWLRGPAWVAVAVTLAAAMFIASRLMPSPPAQRPPAATLGSLNVLADRPDALDAALTQFSRTTLPDVTQPGGALQRLSKF